MNQSANSFFKPLLWYVFIVVLSLLPGNNFPDSNLYFKHMDKVVHLIMYGVFGYLLFESLMNSIKKMFLSIIITVVLSFLLGIFVEITQEYFIKNRSGDFYDAAANLSGALFGSLLKCFMYRKNIK